MFYMYTYTCTNKSYLKKAFVNKHDIILNNQTQTIFIKELSGIKYKI